MNLFILFLIIGLSIVLTELILPSNFFIMSLGISFVIESFISFFVNSLTINLLILGFLSLLTFFILKRFRLIFGGSIAMMKESYLGKRVFIKEIINNDLGLAKINNEIWTCECKNLEKDKAYLIKKVDHNKLILENEF